MSKDIAAKYTVDVLSLEIKTDDHEVAKHVSAVEREVHQERRALLWLLCCRRPDVSDVVLGYAERFETAVLKALRVAPVDQELGPRGVIASRA